MLIWNHNSFQVLFDKITSVYFIWEIHFYFSNIQPATPFSTSAHTRTCLRSCYHRPNNVATYKRKHRQFFTTSTALFWENSAAVPPSRLPSTSAYRLNPRWSMTLILSNKIITSSSFHWSGICPFAIRTCRKSRRKSTKTSKYRRHVHLQI